MSTNSFPGGDKRICGSDLPTSSSSRIPTIRQPSTIQLIPQAGDATNRSVGQPNLVISQSSEPTLRHPNSGHILSPASLTAHQPEVFKAFASNQSLSKRPTRPVVPNPIGHMTVACATGTSNPSISNIVPVQTGDVVHPQTETSLGQKGGITTTVPSLPSLQIHTSTSLSKNKHTLFQLSSSLSSAGPSSMPVNMSSVIRGAPIQSQLTHQTPFPSHLPRGAIAAASALSIPKPGSSVATATAVLRPNQTATIQITSNHSSAISHSHSALQSSLNSTKSSVQASHSALQNSLNVNPSSLTAHSTSINPLTPASILTVPKPGTVIPSGTAMLRSIPLTTTTATPSSQTPPRGPLISTLKSSLPPRSNSPALTLASLSQPELQSQGVSLHPSVTNSSSNPNVQITLTPRTSSTLETKPTLTATQPKISQSAPALSLGAPQKILVSQPSSAPYLQHTALAKSAGVNLTTQTQSANMAALNMSLSSSLPASTIASIPVAKVPPQRHQQPVSIQGQLGTPVMSTAAAAADLESSSSVVSHSPHTSQPTSSIPSNLFLSQTHQSSPVINATTTVTSSTNTTSSQSDSRQDRPPLPTMPPYIASTPTDMYQYPFQYNPILGYQQVAAAAAQAQSIPRLGLIPGQSPTLAATLQAAQGLAVSSAPGVRFSHPLMVTVDPTRAPLNMHGQYPAMASSGTEGTRLSSAVESFSSVPAITSTVTASFSVTPSIPSSPQHGNLTSTPVSNPSASPRPSILRKRTAEGPVVKKPFSLSASETLSPHKDSASTPHSNLSSPKTPAGDNSQSSTDTALSAEANTPTPTHNSVDVRIKQEPLDLIENGIPSTPTHGSSSIEASPRKKPRKQLLHANEELKDNNTSSDEDMEKLNDFKEDRLRTIKTELRDEFIDDDGVRWTLEKKRPPINLMNFYNITWKSRNNHFQKHTEIKTKDERRPTVNELSNQRGVVQKASGWKLYHMAAQLDDMNEMEKELCAKIRQIQSSISPKAPSKQSNVDDESGMIHELTQGNVQRCQLIVDQLGEAKGSMLKVLDHKQRIIEIVNKHMSKRPIKKKERS